VHACMCFLSENATILIKNVYTTMNVWIRVCLERDTYIYNIIITPPRSSGRIVFGDSSFPHETKTIIYTYIVLNT